MTRSSVSQVPKVEPLVQSDVDYGGVTDRVGGAPFERFGYRWLTLVGITLCIAMMGLTAMAYLIFRGIGVWGVNIPVAWGFAITNFVWWIGIGHAGTFISAILLLMRQRWRNSINRLSEAMTLFAVAMAGLFPLLHLGRPWKFYYLLPYPDTLGLWPNWRSPLVWDVFAVMTYGTVSLLYWYLGLLPDLSSMRDKAIRMGRKKVALITAIGAMGWRNSARQWQHHQMLYLLLAGLATPLVISVHSIVSMDFTVAIVPGWHSTIFPPYFVAGAIFSGFAMVLTIAIPARPIFGIEDLITVRHLENMAKIMLVTGLVVDYGYLMEFFNSWYSGDNAEMYMTINRMFGHYWPVFWITMVCNVVAPQFLWGQFFRRNIIALFVVTQFINVGMWVERYMIVITSLTRDFTPSAWGTYHGTIWDWAVLIGTIGTFMLLVLLFLRFFPLMSIYEIKELIHAGNTSKAMGTDPAPAAGLDEQGRVKRGSRIARMQIQNRAVHGQSRQPEDSTEHYAQGSIDADELYAISAEFTDAEGLTDAIKRVRGEGYQRLEAYSPLPIEGLAESLGHSKTIVALIVLVGGICGSLGVFCLMAWSNVIDYPWTIAGRPKFSWPSYIPLTFEIGVLGGSLFGVVGFILLNRFPQPYHPVANTPGFLRASSDRFFLTVGADDPQFDRKQTWEALSRLDPVRVSEVPR